MSDTNERSCASAGSVGKQAASSGPCYPDDLGIYRDARGLSERCRELAARLVKHGIRTRVTEGDVSEAVRPVEHTAERARFLCEVLAAAAAARKNTGTEGTPGSAVVKSFPSGKDRTKTVAK
jgi:hypothetical protein